MKCPFCGHQEDKVMDSRPSKGGSAIRRRRECLKCEKRFTTYEQIEEILPMVVKRDGRREPFDRLKIVAGVRKAVEKRPVSSEKIEALVDDIDDAQAWYGCDAQAIRTLDASPSTGRSRG